MTPALQLALTPAAVLSVVGTAAGRDVCMSELGGGVPAALSATGKAIWFWTVCPPGGPGRRAASRPAAATRLD